MNKEKALIITMEECGELTRACSKILRHGYVQQKHINSLHEELGDVVAMTRLIQELYSIDNDTLEFHVWKRNLKMKGAEYK